MSDEIDRYYKRQAKEHVEYMYDARMLNDNLSKETLNKLENYIGYLFQSYAKSAANAAVLSTQVKMRLSADNP